MDNSHKIKALSKISYNSPKVTAALQLLSDNYSNGDFDSKLTNGNELRSEIDSSVLDLYEKYIESQEPLKNVIRELDSSLDSVASVFSKELITLEDGKSTNSHSELLSNVTRLQERREILQKRLTLVEGLLNRVVLSSKQQHALCYGLVTDNGFFDALDSSNYVLKQSERIRKVLPGFAALVDETDTITRTTQESAYERLFQWTSVEIEAVLGMFTAKSDSPDIPFVLLRAFEALVVSKPILWQHLLDQVARVRRSNVHSSFMKALTIGDPEIGIRPIERHAHDPKRYLSDILAWLHQTLAGEKELFILLMASHIDKDILVQMLNTVLEVGCRTPLEERVDSVLGMLFRESTSFSNLNLNPAASLSTLTLFGYQLKVLEKLLGSRTQSSIVNSLWRKLLKAKESFKNGLIQRVSQLNSIQFQVTDELVPPLELVQLCSELEELLDVINNEGENDDKMIEWLRDIYITPMFDLIESQAANINHVASAAVFSINCLDRMAPLAEKSSKIDSEFKHYSSQIIQAEVRLLLTKSGLFDVLDDFNIEDHSITLRNKSNDNEKKKILNGFWEYLTVSQSSILELKWADRIRNATFKTGIRLKTSSFLSKVYEVIYESIQPTVNKNSIFPPQEVNLLLGI